MFEYYEIETAPKDSKEMLEKSKASYSGLVPNLHKLFAGAPITYASYNKCFGDFLAKSGFSKLEAQVVFMTSNYYHDCHYCMAGHTWGMTSAKLPSEVIEALREGKKIPDEKLEALRSFTWDLIDKRGHVGDERVQQFLDAGYTPKHALEILAGLASKLISNYTNALAHTKLDLPMEKFAWKRPEKGGDVLY